MESQSEYANRMLDDAFKNLNRARSLANNLDRLGKDVAESLEDELHSVRAALTKALTTVYSAAIEELEHADVEVGVERLWELFHGIDELFSRVF